MLQQRYMSSEQQARLQERNRPSGQCRSVSSSVVCQGLALDCSDQDTAHLKSPLLFGVTPRDTAWCSIKLYRLVLTV